MDGQEELLLKEVGSIADYPLEQYDSDLRKIRILGDVLLKTSSRAEGYVDEIIVNWNEQFGIKTSITKSVKSLLKYMPILSGMYFLGKVKALVDYKIIKKDDSLHAQLKWLNEQRNLFAHFNVYRYELARMYKSKQSRIKTLKKLKTILMSLQMKELVIRVANDKISS